MSILNEIKGFKRPYYPQTTIGCNGNTQSLSSAMETNISTIDSASNCVNFQNTNRITTVVDSNGEEWEEEVSYTIVDLGMDSPLINQSEKEEINLNIKTLGLESIEPIIQIGAHLFQGKKFETIGTDMVFKVNGSRSKTVKDVTIKENTLDLSLKGVSTEKFIGYRIQVSNVDKDNNNNN